jgi:hypothetical protein
MMRQLKSITTNNGRYKMHQSGEELDDQPINVIKLPTPRHALLFGSRLHRASHNEHRQTLHLITSVSNQRRIPTMTAHK